MTESNAFFFSKQLPALGTIELLCQIHNVIAVDIVFVCVCFCVCLCCCCFVKGNVCCGKFSNEHFHEEINNNNKRNT